MATKIKRKRVPMDEKQKRRLQIAIVALCVAGALFFAGFSVGRNNESTRAAITAIEEQSVLPVSRTRTESTSLGPKNFDLIIPTGFKKSEDGAKKAAAIYVESWAQMITSTDAQVITAINFVTNPEATQLRASLADTITTARAPLSDAIAGQIYHQSVPMKIKVNSYDPENATISVWSAEFWAAAGDLDPIANFDLHELKLVYINGDWKIDSWVTTPGPTPEWAYKNDPMNSIDFIGALAGYEEYKR